MKKIVAIFAHPDDESFGPGGTIALLSKNSAIFTICVTGGDAGKNARKRTSRLLSDIRLDEYKKAAKILGVTKSYNLNFQDGALSNSLYHEVSDKIEPILNKIKPDTLITYEPKGVSGHIDHIAVSMITTYLFKKHHEIKKLMYYCIRDIRRNKNLDDYFIYFPEGYNISAIDKKVNIASVLNQKIEAIKAHKSQKEDGDRIIHDLLKAPPYEYFLIKKQNSTSKKY